MRETISHLLIWLNAHPQLAGLVTFLISAGESVAIIGTIVPGSIMMTAIGALAGAGVIPLWETILWAILGAIIGDGISYWLGYYFKGQLPHIWPFRKYPMLLKTGEKFFLKYGSMSVFIGRFVGPVRALVPVAAGMLGMKPLQFTLANVASAIGWAPIYMLPGILVGAASLELPHDIAMHVILVFLLFSLFVLLCLWFIYKLLELIHTQTTQLQNTIWTALKKSRYFSITTKLLRHYNPKETHGQLTLTLYFSAAVILLLSLITFVKLLGPGSIGVNDAVFHLFRGIRNDTLDRLMLNITLLGQKQIVIILTIILSVWLILVKRWRAAIHMLLLIALAGGSVFILKHMLHVPRPWGINPQQTFSMPSGHATLSTVFFIFIAYFIAMNIRPRRRWPVYALGILLGTIVGISRMYLGAHWFTDTLAGWLLGSALLLLIIISYQRRAEKKVNPITLSLMTVISLSILLIISNVYYYNQLKQTYTMIPWPVSEITMSEWWQRDDLIPAYRASLFGFPTQRINVEWIGNIDQIKKTLMAAGWSEPPARDWVSIFHRLADVSSRNYLPLVSPHYLDKKPELILTRQLQIGNKPLLVLRFWNSNRLTKDSHQVLWVGIAGVIPRSYSWLYRRYSGHVDIDPNIVFPNKLPSGQWQWKIMMVKEPKLLNPQKILLLRKK